MNLFEHICAFRRVPSSTEAVCLVLIGFVPVWSGLNAIRILWYSLHTPLLSLLVLRVSFYIGLSVLLLIFLWSFCFLIIRKSCKIMTDESFE